MVLSRMEECYVLLLEGVKPNIYVGRSKDADKRVQDHFQPGGASVWTGKHKPISLLERVPGGKEMEKYLTIKYKIKYGDKHVKGAGYTPSRPY